MKNLILYGTAGCHLCEEAEALLRHMAASLRPGEAWSSVDIAAEEALMERYGVRIPVLYRRDLGTELGWPFGVEELAAFLVGMDAARDGEICDTAGAAMSAAQAEQARQTDPSVCPSPSIPA